MTQLLYILCCWGQLTCFGRFVSNLVTLCLRFSSIPSLFSRSWTQIVTDARRNIHPWRFGSANAPLSFCLRNVFSYYYLRIQKQYLYVRKQYLFDLISFVFICWLRSYVEAFTYWCNAWHAQIVWAVAFFPILVIDCMTIDGWSFFWGYDWFSRF